MSAAAVPVGHDADVGAPTLVIEPSGAIPRLNLGELWAYRGLFRFLVWRDIKVRYSQTVLGGLWAVLQPVLTMSIFAVIFGRFARIPSEGAPYPVFALAALVPWTFFSAALTGASGSLTASTGLITKIYFPRLLIPTAAVVAGLLDFAVGFAFLTLFMGSYHIAPAPIALIAVPVSIAAMLLTLVGAACWLSALNVQYRDVRFVVPFLVQIWMYASPVIYPMSMVPDRYRVVYALNPMAGAIEGFRTALLGRGTVPWGALGISLAIGTVLCATGALYFRRAERVFADVA